MLSQQRKTLQCRMFAYATPQSTEYQDVRTYLRSLHLNCSYRRLHPSGWKMAKGDAEMLGAGLYPACTCCLTLPTVRAHQELEYFPQLKDMVDSHFFEMRDRIFTDRNEFAKASHLMRYQLAQHSCINNVLTSSEMPEILRKLSILHVYHLNSELKGLVINRASAKQIEEVVLRIAVYQRATNQVVEFMRTMVRNAQAVRSLHSDYLAAHCMVAASKSTVSKMPDDVAYLIVEYAEEFDDGTTYRRTLVKSKVRRLQEKYEYVNKKYLEHDAIQWDRYNDHLYNEHDYSTFDWTKSDEHLEWERKLEVVTRELEECARLLE